MRCFNFNRFARVNSRLTVFLVASMASYLLASNGHAQTDEVQGVEDVAVQQDGGAAAASEKDDPSVKDEVVVDTKVVVEPKPKLSEQFARLHLRDGSIIGGEIGTKTIDVKTNFGTLTVPISRVVQIYPGLKSTPELNQRIAQLVEDLGGREMAKRDKAQKELTGMGVKIMNILRDYGDGGNAERKKRLATIRSEFSEQLEDEYGADDSIAQLSFEDRVVTPDFSIVGEIQQQEFQVVSKYGKLNVKLEDLKLADRQIHTAPREIRRNVSVPAMAFFQKQPKSTGIRVNKGDKISIRADGVVQWTNWNNSSTPEGLTNRSNWNGIHSGKLVARIGNDNSNCVAIGSKGEFVAKASGKLYLGIAMRDSYANNTSYRWAGEYKARIRVKPKNQ